MSDGEKVEQTLLAIEALTKKLSAKTKKLTKQGSLDRLGKELTAKDSAMTSATIGYLLNGLYRSYMKISAIDPENHKINDEIERNRVSFKKIKEVFAENEGAKNGNEKESLGKRKTLDEAAAMRLAKPYLLSRENQKKPVSKEPSKETGTKRQMTKGSVLPQRDHLSWKQQLKQLKD